MTIISSAWTLHKLAHINVRKWDTPLHVCKCKIIILYMISKFNLNCSYVNKQSILCYNPIACRMVIRIKQLSLGDNYQTWKAIRAIYAIQQMHLKTRERERKVNQSFCFITNNCVLLHEINNSIILTEGFEELNLVEELTNYFTCNTQSFD